MAVSINRTVAGGAAPSKETTAITPVFNSGLINVGSSVGFYYRLEDRMFMNGGFGMMGSGSSAVAVKISLPIVDGVQLTINTAKLSGGDSTTNQESTMLGSGQWFDAGTAFKDLDVLFHGTSTVQFNENPGILASSQLATGDGIKYDFSVPISQWD